MCECVCVCLNVYLCVCVSYVCAAVGNKRVPQTGEAAAILAKAHARAQGLNMLGHSLGKQVLYKCVITGHGIHALLCNLIFSRPPPHNKRLTLSLVSIMSKAWVQGCLTVRS